LQIAPRAAFSAGAAAWAQRNGPIRLVLRIDCQNPSVSRSSSANGIGTGVAGVPALLTRKSSRPSASIARPGHRFGLDRLRHVARRGDDLVAEPFQPRDLIGAAGIVGQMVERDRGTAAGKDLNRGETDAGGTAGDERGLAAEIGADHVGGDFR